MRRFAFYLVPTLLLLFFVTVMTTGAYLKKPMMGDTDDVQKHLQIVQKDIQNDNWANARSDLIQLKSAWKKIIPRVQFSVERDEVNRLDSNLDRLAGYLDAHDKGGALSELSEAKRHWQELGR